MTRLTLFLPKSARLFTSEAGEVTYGFVIATNKSPSVVLDIAKLLFPNQEGNNNDFTKVIKTKEGEYVGKGMLLARQSGMLPFSKKSVKSPCNGTITRIDWKKGEVEIIAEEVGGEDIISPVDGKVVSITKDALIIEFKGVIVFAKRGLGKKKKGKLLALSKEDDNVTLPEISQVHKDKILLGGVMNRQVMEKAFGIGALSILATTITDSDFDYFENSWKFPISLGLVSKADYRTLLDYVDRDVVVEGEHKRIIIQN